MSQPYLKVPNCDNFLIRIISRLQILYYDNISLSRGVYIIKISLNDVHVTSNRLQVVVRLLGTQVASANHVLYLARYLHRTR